MKRISYWLVALLLVLGCSKEEKTWTVTYTVNKVGNGEAIYRATYLLPSGAEKEEGPLDGAWLSSSLRQFEDGKRVMLRIERISGTAALELNILRDGAVHEQGNLPSGTAQAEIRDNL